MPGGPLSTVQSKTCYMSKNNLSEQYPIYIYRDRTSISPKIPLRTRIDDAHFDHGYAMLGPAPPITTTTRINLHTLRLTETAEPDSDKSTLTIPDARLLGFPHQHTKLHSRQTVNSLIESLRHGRELYSIDYLFPGREISNHVRLGNLSGRIPSAVRLALIRVNTATIASWISLISISGRASTIRDTS